jgi:hypothetical protein
MKVLTKAERERYWARVTDARCECGHLKSEHGGIVNHLGCARCASCRRFTWSKFILRK